MTGTVYFVECAGRIKVGYSKSLERRLSMLSTICAHPVSLIGTIKGSVKLERAIHRAIEPHRAQGEWFHDCAQVRSVVTEVISMGGEAIGFQEPEGRKCVPRTAPTYMKDYGEHAAALRKLAEPLVFGDRTKDAIDRAAKRAGLSYWRAFDIWYGKARRIEAEEVRMIQQAAA